MTKCFWRKIWWNIRYFNTFIMQGMIAQGHDFEYTGGIHSDHWEMQCRDCKETACSEVGPDAKLEEI